MDIKRCRDVRIFAQNCNGRSGFDIYLSFSGQQEYLMFHRHNFFLYELLKDGLRLDEFERQAKQMIGDLVTEKHRFQLHGSNPSMKKRRNLSRRLENSVGHLCRAVDEYMIYERAIA